MEYLKQSTAATVKIGPFLDDTDGKTAETALAIAQADIRLSKNGGAFAQTNNATGATHDEKGWYGVPLNTTDTGTLGRLRVAVHESGALPCFAEYMVLPANVYDSLCSTDKLQVDLLQMGGVAQSATDLKDFADAGYDPATNKVQGVVLTDTCTTNTDMAGTDNAALATTALSNATWTDAKAGYLNHSISTVDTVVDGIQTDLSNATDGLGALKTLIDTVNTDLSNGTDGLGALKTLIDTVNTDLSNGTDGLGALKTLVDALNDVSTSDLATALTNIHLDHLLAANYDPASKPGVATALLNELVENDVGVSRFTENALEQAPSGTGASAATIADAVWDELKADHTIVNSFGDYFDASNLPTDIANIKTQTDAIETDTQDIQSRIPAALVTGRMSSDAVAISGSTDAADHLEASAETVVVGAAAAGTLSTTQMTTDLTEATNDHYNGRIIIWTSGVLKDQATNATDYDGATKKLIYTAVTEAPSDGDTFVLV